MKNNFVIDSEAFLVWLNASGATVSSQIALQDARPPGAGRGVVARCNINADQVLFTIPRNLVLCARNSSLFTEHKHVLEELEGDPWLQLVLVMIYEFGLGEKSAWKAYFDILPTDFDTLMYWTDEEVAELEACAVVAKIGRAEAEAVFTNKILPIIAKHPTLFGFDDDVAIDVHALGLAHRMASTIMAYAFDIEPQEKDIDEDGFASEEEDEDLEKAMVPLADMLNADGTKNNARLFYEHDALVMKSITPISTGEEIYNDYGSLPRSDLLRRYGYITPNYAIYDVVEISRDLVVKSARNELNHDDRAISERLGILNQASGLEDAYEITRGVAPMTLATVFQTELLALVLVLSSPAEQLCNLERPMRAFHGMLERNEIPSWWYKLMRAVLQQRMSEYGRSLNEDKQFLRDLNSTGDSAGILYGFEGRKKMNRKIMATEIRIGEKEILADALELVMTSAAALKEASSAAGKKREVDDQEASALPKKKS